MTPSAEQTPSSAIQSLFEDGWYAARYSEASVSGLGPLAHFLKIGDAAGFCPHPLFDGDYYSKQYPEIPKHGGERLRHYVEIGEGRGASPHRLFDSSFYLEKNPDLRELDGLLLAHYHRFGAGELRSPCPLFSPGWYCDQRPQRKEARLHPLLDYIEYGDSAGLAPHPLFDPAYYGSQNPEIPAEGGQRLIHYLNEGGREGSNPHPLFRSRFYLERAPALEASKKTPLEHYLGEGEATGLCPNPIFDPQYYLAENPDLRGVESLLAHYVEYGAGEGRRTSRFFLPQFYQDQLLGGGLKKSNLLAHYLDSGEEDGLLPHPLFDPTYYAGECPEVGFGQGSRLAHYLEHGHRAGGAPHPLFQPAYYAGQVGSLGTESPVRAFPSPFSSPSAASSGPCETLLSHYLVAGEAQGLKPNPLFDPVHYAKHDSANQGAAGISLLEHYVLWGGAAGLSPSILFDSAWVSRQIPGDARTRQNPMTYYFQEKGRLVKGPHPLFLASWYESQNPGVAESGLDPLSHFMELGAKARLDPHPLFYSAWYLDFHSGQIAEKKPAIFHYIELGESQGLTPNPFFDAAYYVRHHGVQLAPGETPFAHFCNVGMDLGYRPSPLYSFCLQFFRDKREGRRCRSDNPAGGYFSPLYSSLTSPGSEIPIRLPAVYVPDVSIIIPVHGQHVYTLACLRSISKAENSTTYEILVIDDHSPLDQYRALSEIENLRLFRNEEQLGFLRTCNRGAREARGKDLIFLNNDTLVTDHWIDRLLETREAFPNAGLIGSKLIFPDGRLQEAGSLVWSDGTAMNYGYGEDPSDPRYAFARETDYVSAASVLIQAETFSGIGGFDERYAPAFYEDTDLAFRVREAGMDVVYQPHSIVIHFGGASHGRDTSGPLKKYQLANQETFHSRWQSILRKQPDSGSDPDRAALRRSGPRALVIDAEMLTPDQDSGSLRMYNFLKVIKEVGYAVTFMPCNLQYRENYTEALERNGIFVVRSPHTNSVERFLEETGSEFELCIVSRPDTAEQCLDLTQLLCPNALVLYDTVDLHYLRRERELRLTGLALAPESIRTQELRAVARADGAITVSDFDRKKLMHEVPGAPIHVVSNIHEIHPQKRSFSDRDGILFIGSFQHTPNVDATLWFITDVFPIIHAWIPDLRFHVIGPNPPEEIREYASEHIVIEGFIENIDEQFSSRRLSVAPLRYGSGVKGKINQSMAYGLPCVATPSAVEGMGLDWKNEISVAESAQEFAEAVAELYGNEEYWTLVSGKSIKNIERSFSPSVAEDAIRKILEYHGRKCPEPDPSHGSGS